MALLSIVGTVLQALPALLVTCALMAQAPQQPNQSVVDAPSQPALTSAIAQQPKESSPDAPSQPALTFAIAQQPKQSSPDAPSQPALTSAIAQQPRQSSPDAPSQPALTSAQQSPLDPKLPTLFIVGDSTARNKEDLGWGDHLAHFFNLNRINVANRARAGRSSRTFINEGSWDAVLKEMKPGDFVLLQMGHNDGGDLGGAKPRGTLKGIGEEMQQVPQTTGPLAGQTETVHTYGWYLRKYITDTRAHGVTPILLTLTVRNIWTPDASGQPHIERDMKTGDSTYDTEIREIGSDQHVSVVDMAKPAADEFEHLGETGTTKLFPIDHTHTSPQGAELNAGAVVTALRSAHSQLVTYLKAP